MPVQLRNFHNEWYHPGRSLLWQAGWFFLGLPLLRCAVLPSSGVRVRLLRIFGGKIGERVSIKPGVRVKFPWRLTVGDDCWLGEDCWIDNLAQVSIEHDTCISQGAYLCTGNHDWSDPHFGLVVKPIVLRAGSWVGARSVISPGVELGIGSIAAAGSIVTRSIPDFEIHGGNPAAFLKRRDIRADGSADSGPEAANAPHAASREHHQLVS